MRKCFQNLTNQENFMALQRHKFSNINEITIDNLKLRPIIAQTGTYTYNAAQVIAEYLKPFCSVNNYIIRNMQEFPVALKQQDPLLPDEE